MGVLALLAEKDALLADTARELKAPSAADLPKKASALQGELKSAKAEIESLEAKMASAKLSAIADNCTEIGAFHLYTAKAEGVSIDAARNVCDNLKASDASAVVLMAVIGDGKLNFIAGCGKDALKAGAHAGNLVKQVAAICNGGGGGRPDNATAGGKDLTKVDEALAAAPAIVGAMQK